MGIYDDKFKEAYEKDREIEFQKEIKETEDAIIKLEAKLEELLKKCKHRFKELTKKQLADEWMSEDAYCVICKRHYGWRCKESPDQTCHYFSTNGEVELLDGTKAPVPEGHCEEDENDDWCIFCGQPDERK